MPTDLTELILLARRRVRLMRARRRAVWGCVLAAGAMVAATWTGWKDQALISIALIPVAAIIGFVRRSPGDLSIAQHLDEQLHTRDLLASGIACRDRDDDAGRLIVAQANAFASRVDRTRFGVPQGVSRGELAAGLLVGIAIVLTVVWSGPTAPTDGSIATRTGNEPSGTVSNPRPVIPSRPADEARNAIGPEGKSSERNEPDHGGSADSNERPGPSRDAAGEGMASTESRTLPPPLHSISPATSTVKVTDAGETGTGTASGGSHGVSGSGMAARQPVSVAKANRPGEAARDRARRALEADQLDYASRDLVRAYFDLEQPR